MRLSPQVLHLSSIIDKNDTFNLIYSIDVFISITHIMLSLEKDY